MPKWELGLLLLTAAMTVLVDLTVAIGVGTLVGLTLQWLKRGKHTAV